MRVKSIGLIIVMMTLFLVSITFAGIVVNDNPLIYYEHLTNNAGENTNHISLDSQGIAHVLFMEDIYNNSRYGNNSGGSWSFSNISNADNTYPFGLAIDSNDKIHTIGVNLSGSSTLYCNNTASDGSWSCANISILLNTFPGIAIDSNDKVHIAYTSFSGSTAIGYCNNTASDGSWSCNESVEEGPFYGWIPDILIDSNDKVHIFHTDAIGGVGDTLRYCNNTASDGSWSCGFVPDVGRLIFVSSVIDSTDKIHIIGKDNDDNDKLYYANKTIGGGLWSSTIMSESAQPGDDSCRLK